MEEEPSKLLLVYICYTLLWTKKMKAEQHHSSVKIWIFLDISIANTLLLFTYIYGNNRYFYRCFVLVWCLTMAYWHTTAITETNEIPSLASSYRSSYDHSLTFIIFVLTLRTNNNKNLGIKYAVLLLPNPKIKSDLRVARIRGITRTLALVQYEEGYMEKTEKSCSFT